MAHAPKLRAIIKMSLVSFLLAQRHDVSEQ